ncbi:MAG: hypothetical protein ACHQ02_09055, partial [Candidatus Limnocylindrales bacterium]
MTSDTGELRPSTPTRRPDTARPREGREEVEPPSGDELAAIETHLATLPLHSGARVRHEAGLGLTLIEGQRQGAGFDYGAVIRWPAGQWEERLARFERSARGRNGWPSLLVAHGLAEPADLEERLAGRGWTQVVAET